MTASLKLISHKLCPYVQRAVIALNEKGVPFERIDIDLANKPDWFLKTLAARQGAGAGRDDREGRGRAVREQRDLRIHRGDARRRKAASGGSAEARRSTAPGWSSARRSSVTSGAWRPRPIRRRSKASARRIAAKFARVEAALGAGPFFAGEAFSLVDAVFAPIFRYFDVFDELTELGIFSGSAEGAGVARGAGEASERAHRGRRGLSAIAARLPRAPRRASAEACGLSARRCRNPWPG